jgi:hypothetical protein
LGGLLELSCYGSGRQHCGNDLSREVSKHIIQSRGPLEALLMLIQIPLGPNINFFNILIEKLKKTLANPPLSCYSIPKDCKWEA